MHSAHGACFLKASAMASGVEGTLPRQINLSFSSITAIDVSFSDTSRPTYCFSLGMGHVLRLALARPPRYAALQLRHVPTAIVRFLCGNREISRSTNSRVIGVLLWSVSGR